MSSSVHPVDEKLPLWKLLFFGFQHVLAMYSGAVAVPLVLAQAINLDTERLITLTGVRSRYVVATSAVIMMLLGLCPKLAAIVSCIPPMVLGGAGLAMFGMVAASGIRSLSKVEFHDNCNMMVIAISVGVAMIPVCSPGFYSKFPVTMQLICNSSITIGSITAMLLNFLLNKPQKEETFLEEN